MTKFNIQYQEFKNMSEELNDWQSAIFLVVVIAALYGGYTFFFSAEEVTVEWDVNCSSEGYMEFQLNGETVDGTRSSQPCGIGQTYSGVMDLELEEGDILQLVNLQEQGYECEVVISERELSSGYVLCED